MKENKNQLIDYVKANYPIGTKFKSPSSGGIFTVITHQIEVNRDGSVQLRNQGLNCPFLYYNDIWAEIISLPESTTSEVINQFEIY